MSWEVAVFKTIRGTQERARTDGPLSDTEVVSYLQRIIGNPYVGRILIRRI